MKPKLEAQGYTRLKLKYDYPLSSFAFKFNLRRFNKELAHRMRPARAYTRSRQSSTLATPGHIHELSWFTRWTEELKLS
jgi:hypothetical protein